MGMLAAGPAAPEFEAFISFLARSSVSYLHFTRTNTLVAAIQQHAPIPVSNWAITTLHPLFELFPPDQHTMYGGYAAGTQAFAGGGFMPSQEQPEARAGGSALKKNFDHKDSTLRAVTVRQLHEAAQQSADDQLFLDGKPVANITIVGKIVQVEEQQLLTLYTVDDGTGKVLAKYWTPDNDDDFDKQRRAEWRVGSYVRAHGHLSTVGHERSMVAFNLRLIQDFNEVTYHSLQVIFQHLHLTKGSGSMGAAAAAGFPIKQEAGGYDAAPAGGAYNAQPAAGGYNPNAGMSPCADAVLKFLQSPEAQNDQGVSILEITGRVGQFNPGQVREAIEFLSNEGHIYSTIDDQHYRTCN